jgi:hypothetical protein
MSHDNYGSQSGNNSINVGVGDFRGANVQVGGSGSGDRQTFTLEELQIQRHVVFGKRIAPREGVSAFGIVTGIAGLLGLYFTLFQAFPSPKMSSWPIFFMMTFFTGAMCLMTSLLLKKRQFFHMLFRRFFLETNSADDVYLSSFTASCPWCGTKMNLRNVGPAKGQRIDLFVCERNPEQHTISLDPTILPDIDTNAMTHAVQRGD